jgi:hypothetical protein
MTISEIFDLPKTDPRWLEFVKEVSIEYPCYICKPEEGSLEEFDRYIAGDR